MLRLKLQVPWDFFGACLFADSRCARFPTQRDLNCLADHDKTTRRKGMQRLKAALQTEAGSSAAAWPEPAYASLGVDRAALATFFAGHLRAPLVGLFGDEVEFVREHALKLVAFFAAKVLAPAAPEDEEASSRALSELAAAVVPALLKRLASTPVAEPTEEIRLAATKLLSFLLDHPSSLLSSGRGGDGDSEGSGVCTILAKTLIDAYPEVLLLLL